MSDEPAHQKKFPVGWVLIVIVLLIGLAIVLNMQRLQGLWQAGSELLALRSTIGEKFDVSDVSVSVAGQSGSAAKHLVVELRNPPFGELPNDELESKAREIAMFAYQEHAADRDYAQIEIVIAKSKNTIITVSEQREFRFSPAELCGQTDGDSSARTPAD